MTLQRCAWCRPRLRFLGVASWWPLWRFQWSDGICRAHKTSLLAEGMSTRLQLVSTRLRTADWYLGNDDRQEIARDIDAVIGRLERMVGRSAT